ncbi:MAG: deoxyribodipyrimidine photo-lyase [Micrococcaceae bacterium]|nr:deoxyribodipyrimidine photo-lyase [Micrococcaceae bacterium]
MNHQSTTLMWFRDDLRLADNPALHAAMAAGNVRAVFILDEESEGIRPLGGAARWWLHHGLEALTEDLDAIGVPLQLHRGPAAKILHGILSAGGTSEVHWNRRYGGPERAVDIQVKELVHTAGATAHSHSGSLLHEPWVPQTQDGRAFKVFTPFYNAVQRLELRPELGIPSPQHPPVPLDNHSAGDTLAQWNLLPTTPDWSQGLTEAWTPGERGAHERLQTVLEEIAGDYETSRNRPDIDGTSRLSPALRWGHLSPIQVWESLSASIAAHPERAEGTRAMMRQLVWRDFCWNLLYHHPLLPTQNLRAEFDAFDWAWPDESGDATEETLAQHLAAWRHGGTGYGMVDAGMKQLWETGWMHNRVRMVTASFLIKNLGIHWRIGEQWFWDTLVDADAASNPANWQWVAGCGADASPFFRVFNPELQAKKFDPHGSYVTRFAPLPSAEPLVDLKASRAAALDAYAQMKER